VPPPTQHKVIETLGCHSLKFGAQLRKLAVVRWRYSREPSPERVCDDIKDDLIRVLNFMPTPETQHYKAELKKFTKQLECMWNMSEILVIMIQYNPEFMKAHMHQFFCFFKNLIAHLPSFENNLRYNILY